LTAPTSSPTSAPTSAQATVYVQPTSYSGNKPNCNSPSTYFVTYSSANPSTAYSLSPATGDNPTLNLVANLQYTFVNNGATSGIYISNSPTYAAGNLVTSQQATVSGQGGAQSLTVTFLQSGTYYYTSQSNSFQHGVINVASYSCF
jgi:hypothetical protein